MHRFLSRTARENVTFGLEQRGVPEAERRERVRELLELVGLEEAADAYPKQLSGGMKQRVGIARALAVDSELLLMDEPFGAVDPQTRAVLQEELLDLWEHTGKTVLFVTHDVEGAVKLADRAVVKDADPGTVRAGRGRGPPEAARPFRPGLRRVQDLIRE